MTNTPPHSDSIAAGSYQGRELDSSILPNVKDEPRPWLARAVLLGARIVTDMVVGSGALLGTSGHAGEHPFFARIFLDPQLTKRDLRLKSQLKGTRLCKSETKRANQEG